MITKTPSRNLENNDKIKLKGNKVTKKECSQYIIKLREYLNSLEMELKRKQKN
jgi:hypothetical protein